MYISNPRECAVEIWSISRPHILRHYYVYLSDNDLCLQKDIPIHTAEHKTYRPDRCVCVHSYVCGGMTMTMESNRLSVEGPGEGRPHLHVQEEGQNLGVFATANGDVLHIHVYRGWGYISLVILGSRRYINCFTLSIQMENLRGSTELVQTE